MGLKTKKWFQSIIKFAPTVATALGGPLAGAAMNVIKGALNLPADAGDAAIEAAMEQATPADFLALKKGEQEFLALMREYDIKEDDLVYKDIADARAMRVATKDWMPGILTGIALTFFFTLAFAVMYNLEIVTGESKDFAFYLFGVASGWVTQGMSFFLGSSKGSQRKTDMLNEAAVQK